VILAACGLQREARLIARAGWVAVAGGGDAARLERELTEAIGSSSQRRPGSRAASEAPVAGDPGFRRGDGRGMILSIGLAGALSPELTVGDVVIASLAADEGRGKLAERLHGLLPTARLGTIVGQDLPAATLADKQQLYAATGALAVDMESHVAARVAAAHGLPFAAIRAISDDAGRTLPPAALVGMKPDGGMALGAVLASLARAPAQLPALIRTGIDAERAFGALRGALDALEAGGIGRLDLGELGLDV
jgi:adenosylhomocysteine nucleosidase